MRTTKYTCVPSNTVDEDGEDVAVDFSNAVLYIGALQTIAATVLTSTVSIVACVAMPGRFVSAVRTLVLSSIVGVSVVRKPFRLGRVHGLSLVFRALQPCVAIYISSEIAEQLVHTCTNDLSAPSWRRLVFHSMCGLMLFSGFMRARRPLAETDLPFLLTLSALFVMAMLPPPAVLLAGPLCSAPTLASAAERITRAFVFSLLYSVFVYAAAPPVQSSAEVIICMMRASAASIWVLGIHVTLLPCAVIQGAIVIYIRIFGDEYQLDEYDYTPSMRSNPVTDEEKDTILNEFDLERASPARQSPPAPPPTNTRYVGGLVGAVPASVPGGDMIMPKFQQLGTRGLVDIASTTPSVGVGGCTDGFGGVNIAAITARIEAETVRVAS